MIVANIAVTVSVEGNLGGGSRGDGKVKRGGRRFGREKKQGAQEGGVGVTAV